MGINSRVIHVQMCPELSMKNPGWDMEDEWEHPDDSCMGWWSADNREKP